MPVTREELIKRFSHHAPKTTQVGKTHELTRAHILQCAVTVLGLIPDSRESAVFVTKMEEAMFWAMAAIARNQS